MFNCALLKFKNISSKGGYLTPVEGERDIPFKMKRIYYITGVEAGISRGFHAHRRLHQVLICLNGSVKIKLKNSQNEEIVELKNSSIGLYVGPMIWREMFDFTENSVLLVVASEYYDESDYIRDYDSYVKEAENIF